MAQGTVWEYRVVTHPMNHGDYGELASVLNEHGGEGWELVTASLLHDAGHDIYVATFKRMAGGVRPELSGIDSAALDSLG